MIEKKENSIFPGLLCLFLPLILITVWFMNDGGISFGYNFFYYWIWMIGYLILFDLGALILLLVKANKKQVNQHIGILLFIGFMLLMGSLLYFMANLN